MCKFEKFIEKYHRPLVYAVCLSGFIFVGVMMLNSTSTPPEERQNREQGGRSLISPLNPMNPASPFFPNSRP